MLLTEYGTCTQDLQLLLHSCVCHGVYHEDICIGILPIHAKEVQVVERHLTVTDHY